MQTDPLLNRIENALEEHDISKTRFGYVVAGDPTLVSKMRQGRMLKGLRSKVEKALEKLEVEGEI